MGRNSGRAVAAWQAFDKQVPGDLLRAVSGAFAVVACADGGIDNAEVERFAALVRGEPAFRGINPRTLELQFRHLATAIADDFVAGRTLALDAVRSVRGHHDAQLVIRAAQIAIVADERIRDQEERALIDVCVALDLDPKHY